MLTTNLCCRSIRQYERKRRRRRLDAERYAYCAVAACLMHALYDTQQDTPMRLSTLTVHRHISQSENLNNYSKPRLSQFHFPILKDIPPPNNLLWLRSWPPSSCIHVFRQLYSNNPFGVSSSICLPQLWPRLVQTHD